MKQYQHFDYYKAQMDVYVWGKQKLEIELWCCSPWALAMQRANMFTKTKSSQIDMKCGQKDVQTS